jgi:hypothetical protein
MVLGVETCQVWIVVFGIRVFITLFHIAKDLTGLPHLVFTLFAY